ncbi:MAG: hypothetical protein HF978_02430 [Desulfobacteraceae bacterium]|nr:hypothetical protein [Desulfobacteraceae bacterium]MBC2754381.1 hypothetical protein [Desulfobacteraceae bacterium]
MKLVRNSADRFRFTVPENISEEITDSDEAIFFKITSHELTSDQINQIVTPSEIYPRERALLAIHWHPEFIPMELNTRRIAAMFPNTTESLIIPTQHNQLMTYEDFTGVEMDCYSSGFNQKVQLLLHFKNEHIENADVLKSMLAHTFKYRSSQLFDYIHTIIKPIDERISQAACETGTDESLIRFVTVYVRKIHDLLDRHMDHLPKTAIKNKILRNFFDELCPTYGDHLINRVQTFITAVKKIVKANFSKKFFYRTSEVIEEVRSLKGGIVVPHPEQFWPILLAEYDVDGYEVWNPQSRRYTEFLIKVLDGKNKTRNHGQKQLLIFMGDDTHMGEKTKDPSLQKPEKALREIGLQPAWEDLNICKQLICANTDKRKVISEYRQRLSQ